MKFCALCNCLLARGETARYQTKRDCAGVAKNYNEGQLYGMSVSHVCRHAASVQGGFPMLWKKGPRMDSRTHGKRWSNVWLQISQRMQTLQCHQRAQLITATDHLGCTGAFNALLASVVALVHARNKGNTPKEYKARS